MIKIGLVGLGGMGTVHYMNYKHIQDASVVALVGASEGDRLKAKEWNLPIYESIEELCEKHSVDLIDICTPTFLHYDHISQALNCNVNVICEKPLSLRSDKAQDLFDLAKKKKKHLYIAHVVQFMKETEILRDLVKTARFGKPLDACFERLSSIPQWGSDSWMFDKEKAGLIPFDLHIHDLDVIVSLFGTPSKVDFTQTNGLSDFPEQYRFFYSYDNLNVVGEAAWFNAQIPFTARWRVYFEKAYVVNDGKQLIAYPDKGEAIVFDTTEAIQVETGINVPPTGMYLAELNHFIDCVKQDADSDRVSQQQVVAVIKVLESISSQT